VSLEIQLPSYCTSQAFILQEFPKVVSVLKLIEFITNQFKVFKITAAEFKNMTIIHVASTDIMLSPGMTSLGRISVGRGRIPFHGPTIGQSIRPWHRQSRVLRGITWNKSYNARLSILILSK
jgi:hypothetical protein